jgi:hypothetical protein
MRGPPGGRAQEGRRQPHGEVNGFLPPLEEKLTACPGGVRRSYFKNTRVNGPVFLGLCEASQQTQSLLQEIEIEIGRLFNNKRTRSAAEPLARLLVLTHKWEAT